MISDSLQELLPGEFTGMIRSPGGYNEIQHPGQEKPQGTRVPLDSLVNIQQFLEDSFGEKSAQGILIRVGRASFISYLKDRGEMLGWFGLSFKMLSTRKRLMNGLETLSQNLYHYGDNPISLSSEEESWIWHDQDCPWCLERKSHGPSCSFTTGFLQEFTYWAGAGKTYLVREVECIAGGGRACAYRVHKKPLD